jgi:hypothetical protein
MQRIFLDRFTVRRVTCVPSAWLQLGRPPLARTLMASLAQTSSSLDSCSYAKSPTRECNLIIEKVGHCGLGPQRVSVRDKPGTNLLVARYSHHHAGRVGGWVLDDALPACLLALVGWDP